MEDKKNIACNCEKEADIEVIKNNIKAIFRRMDEQLSLTKAVYQLTSQIEVLTTRFAGLDEKVTKIDKEIEIVKAKPAQRWESIVGMAITAVVGGLITFLLVKLGMK